MDWELEMMRMMGAARGVGGQGRHDGQIGGKRQGRGISFAGCFCEMGDFYVEYFLVRCVYSRIV
jgi:hypothetical protein